MVGDLAEGGRRPSVHLASVDVAGGKGRRLRGERRPVPGSAQRERNLGRHLGLPRVVMAREHQATLRRPGNGLLPRAIAHRVVRRQDDPVPPLGVLLQVLRDFPRRVRHDGPHGVAVGQVGDQRREGGGAVGLPRKTELRLDLLQGRNWELDQQVAQRSAEIERTREDLRERVGHQKYLLRPVLGRLGEQDSGRDEIVDDLVDLGRVPRLVATVGQQLHERCSAAAGAEGGRGLGELEGGQVGGPQRTDQ